MSEIKLTKNELRLQQTKLNQLLKYLPTLQLKKAMLQLEVAEAKAELAECRQRFERLQSSVLKFAYLLDETGSVDIEAASRIDTVKRRYDNIAGVEVPYFEAISFKDYDYSLLDSPVWIDSAIKQLKELKEADVRIKIAIEKKEALENELREVSIRVNLFEKILIPRAKGFIKKIKVFLGDQELASVSRAKVAKKVLESLEEAGSHAN